MSEGGKTQRPIDPASPGTSTAVEPVLPETHRAIDPSRSRSIGPARFDRIREERASAAAQIQRSLKAWRSASGSAGPAKIPQGSGAPLDGNIRRQMESKLGADLSGARIHTGGDSAQAARDLGARAFTVGTDVHFNAGEFAPGSKEGDKLLAHELTHVVQGQKSGVLF